MRLSRYPRYKPSGAEWLGEIPEHWHVARLRHLGRFLKGSGGSKDDIVDFGVPCVRYGDLYTTHNLFITEARTRVAEALASTYTPILPGDVLFAASGETFEEIGKSAVNLMHGPACCGGDVIILRPTVQIDARFLGYAADSSASAAQKASLGRGTTVKHIYPDQLKRMLIVLPPLAEQAAIASFLDRETARIAAFVADLHQVIELLKEKRQAVIAHAVTKGLDPKVPMRPSGVEWLGDVPKHWAVVRLKRRLAKNEGGVWGQDPEFEDDPIVLRSTEQSIDGHWCIEEPARRCLTDKEKEASLLDCGDLLVTKSSGSSQHIGKTTLVTKAVADLRCCFSNFMQRIRLSEGMAPRWAWHVMNNPVARQQFGYLSNSTTGLANLSGTLIGELQLPIPPLTEQAAIAAFLDSETSHNDLLVKEAEAAITLLQDRRSALISAAVTGHFDVRNAVATEAA